MKVIIAKQKAVDCSIGTIGCRVGRNIVTVCFESEKNFEKNRKKLLASVIGHSHIEV